MTRKKRDELWRPSDHDDEPRLSGKSASDLFLESCDAADRECADIVRNREGEIRLALESAVIEPTATGFMAYTMLTGVSGCFGTGATRVDTMASFRESLERHLDILAMECRVRRFLEPPR